MPNEGGQTPGLNVGTAKTDSEKFFYDSQKVNGLVTENNTHNNDKMIMLPKKLFFWVKAHGDMSI